MIIATTENVDFAFIAFIPLLVISQFTFTSSHTEKTFQMYFPIKYV